MTKANNTCAECGSTNADHGLLCQNCRDHQGYGEKHETHKIVDLGVDNAVKRD